MIIIYYTTPVCVSFIRSVDYVAHTKGWQKHPHYYYHRQYIGEDLLHLKYIKRNK